MGKGEEVEKEEDERTARELADVAANFRLLSAKKIKGSLFSVCIQAELELVSQSMTSSGARSQPVMS